MALNVFSLFAKIGLDTSEYDKGLNESKSKLSSVGNFISKGLGMAASAGVAAIGAATTAVAGLSKEALSSYKDYEQLEGGVKKLYGNMGLSVEEYAAQNNKSVSEVQNEWQKLEDAQNEVLKNAQNAYKTAGMSANQYMETATSFSASLIKSLDGDTKKAAELTDIAMQAISDNYNTFGGDIGMIQGAFQGFAKQNYTMLDNLKLGYGGTKTEMEKLIKDAASYKDIQEKLNLTVDEGSMSFDNIVKAIQVVQEKQQIAGTTAREAMTTIEGSANATKAAWENVITAIGRGEGIEDAFNGLVNSIFGEKEGEGLLNQIIPRLKNIFEGISKFIDTAAPLFSEKIPQIIDNVLPSVLESGSTLILNLSKGIVDALPTVVNTATEVILRLIGAIIELLPNLAAAGAQIVSNLVSSISEAAPQLLEAAMTIINMLVDGITNNVSSFITSGIELISGFVEYILDNLDPIIEAGLEMLVALAQGIGDNLPLLIEKYFEIQSKLVETIIENLPAIIEAGIQIITALAQGIADSMPIIIEHFAKVADRLVKIFNETDWQKVGSDVIELIFKGIELLQDKIPPILKEIAGKAKEWFESVDWKQVGQDIIDLIGKGIEFLSEEIPKALQAIGEKAQEWFKSVDWDKLGSDVITIIGEGIQTLFEEVPSKLREIAEKGKEWFESVDWVEIGNKVVDFIIDGLVAYAELVPEKVREIGETAAEWIRNIDWKQVGYDLITAIITGLEILFFDIPEKLFEIGEHAVDKMKEVDWVELGKNIIQGIIDGVTSLGGALFDAVRDAASGAYEAAKDSLDIASPSKKMMWLGKMVDEGFAKGIKDNTDLVEEQFKGLDNIIETPEVEFAVNKNTNYTGMAQGTGGFVQNLTINAPEQLNPSEIARQTRNANREFVLNMRMA